VFPAVTQLKDTLDDYIQRKAEFIAEFSTDPRISSHAASFFQDLMLPFMSNTALIDTLAANEGFRYRQFDTPDLVIRCFRRGEYASANPIYEEYVPRFRTEMQFPEIFEWAASVRGAPFALRHPEAPSEELIADNCTVPDIPLALPGPVGEMALYSILVNIVRNAAKHGKRRTDVEGEPRRLEVHVVIDAGKAEQSDCSIRIYDSLSEPTAELGKQLNTWIRAPLVEPNGQCRKDAWGIAEMRLCADLLGGLMPGESEEVNLSVAEEKFERAVAPFLNGQQPECLSSSLRIAKARIASFYGWTDVSDRQRSALASIGFLIIDASKPFSPARLEGRHVSQFAVLDARLTTAAIDWQELRRALPPRLIVVGEIPETKHDLAQLAVTNEQPLFPDNAGRSQAKLKPWLWQKWLHHLGFERGRLDKDDRMTVDVFLQQEPSIEPTRTFSRKASAFNHGLPTGNLPAAIRVWATERRNLKCLTNEEAGQTYTRRLIVDRHGIFVSESGYSPQPTDRLFWIDKQNRDFDLLFNPPRTDVEAWTMPYELAEAGLVRILIIDERILQESMKRFAADGAGRAGAARALTGFDGIAPLGWHVAERAGIYLVTHLDIASSDEGPVRTFDVAKQEWTSTPKHPGDLPEMRLSITFGGDKDKVQNLQAQRWAASNSTNGCDTGWHSGGLPLNVAKDIDIAIVHQGVADRLKDEFKEANDVSERFLKALSDSCTLIIESGRGIPPEVQKSNERFLPFSSIERAFNGGRVAKLFLTRTVMETTRRRKT